LRSPRLAIIALLPNLVPLIFITASLAIMGSDLQTSNIVTFTVALGLAVDDTIHFVVRYSQERRQGKSLEEAIRQSFLGAGHAIVLTSILLILGFCTLMGSDLTSTRHFGVLSAVTMVAAILGDLLLLPALLHLFGRTRKAVAQ
jgi:predicted RND superfamily exporter protein